MLYVAKVEMTDESERTLVVSANDKKDAREKVLLYLESKALAVQSLDEENDNENRSIQRD